MKTTPAAPNGLLYGLNDRVPRIPLLIYALQHMIYFIANSVVLPVMMGAYLGLDQVQIMEMVQRTFFWVGAMSLIQALFGHRFPVIDGPAALWMGVVVILANSCVAFGGDLATLRTDLELGCLISGAIVLLLGVTGAIKVIGKVFTPLVNGTILLIMVIQMSSTILIGGTGIQTSADGTIVPGALLVFLLTIVVILIINLKFRGFFQSIATLIGICVGWIVAAAIGQAGTVTMPGHLLSLPQPFAWGPPTFHLNVVIACIICNLALLSIMFTTINGMSDVLQEPVDDRRIVRSTGIFGVSSMMNGLFPTLGFVPFTSSVGFIHITRVGARTPFVAGAILMILLGLIAPVGAFFSAIPAPVGYGALLIIFAMILKQGFVEFGKTSFGMKESFVVGISVIIGCGIMFLPTTAFVNFPQVLRYVISNGQLVGTLIAIFLNLFLVGLKKPAEENN